VFVISGAWPSRLARGILVKKAFLIKRFISGWVRFAKRQTRYPLPSQFDFSTTSAGIAMISVRRQASPKGFL